MNYLDELHSRKELAALLKRSDDYIGAMVFLGFIMPGGRASLRGAMSFLLRHPQPVREAREKRGRGRGR